MLLSVIKRRFPLAVVSVSLLMALLLLNIQPHTAFAQSPSITIDPLQGPRGTLVNATGSNWTPGDHMQVTWENGAILVPDTTIDTNGNFVVSFIVPDTTTPGARTISFTDLNSGYSQPVTFTVT